MLSPQERDEILTRMAKLSVPPGPARLTRGDYLGSVGMPARSALSGTAYSHASAGLISPDP